MKQLSILTLIVIAMTSCSTSQNENEAILNVMNQQETDWNNGNIEGFMEGYWKSDSLMFIGKNGIKYGWKTTLDNYKSSYPDKATMGKLTFEVLKLEEKDDMAYMLGKWSLLRKEDNPGGHFTLYWKKINNNWVITIDHTS